MQKNIYILFYFISDSPKNILHKRPFKCVSDPLTQLLLFSQLCTLQLRISHTVRTEYIVFKLKKNPECLTVVYRPYC